MATPGHRQVTAAESFTPVKWPTEGAGLDEWAAAILTWLIEAAVHWWPVVTAAALVALATWLLTRFLPCWPSKSHRQERTRDD